MTRIPANLARAAVVGTVILGGLAYTQSTEPKPAFVMADIHVSPDTQGGGIRIGFFGARPWVGDGRYEIRRSNLLALINEAYGVDAEKILGGPNWLEWDSYDINAKLPAESTAETQKVMLQNLLADRFKLVVHNDTRDLPSYVLTAGKAPKLKQSEGPGDTGCRGRSTARVSLRCRAEGCRSIPRAAPSSIQSPATTDHGGLCDLSADTSVTKQRDLSGYGSD